MEIAQVEERSVPLSSLVYAPWNWKHDDPDKQERFTASLRKNGLLYKPVAAQRAEEPDNPQWEVCDGNHRLRSLISLGIDPVKIYPVGRIPLAQRVRLGLELNSWEFDTDFFKLSSRIQDLIQAFPVEDLKATLPYSDADFSSFKTMLASFTAMSGEKPVMPEKEALVPDGFVNITIRFPRELYDAWVLIKQQTGVANDVELLTVLMAKFNE